MNEFFVCIVLIRCLCVSFLGNTLDNIFEKPNGRQKLARFNDRFARY